MGEGGGFSPSVLWPSSPPTTASCRSRGGLGMGCPWGIRWRASSSGPGVGVLRPQLPRCRQRCWKNSFLAPTETSVVKISDV